MNFRKRHYMVADDFSIYLSSLLTGGTTLTSLDRHVGSTLSICIGLGIVLGSAYQIVDSISSADT